MARVAIVTGGTRGIGEAISIALKDMGMQVAANYAGNDERARESRCHNRPHTRRSNHSPALSTSSSKNTIGMLQRSST